MGAGRRTRSGRGMARLEPAPYRTRPVRWQGRTRSVWSAPP